MPHETAAVLVQVLCTPYNHAREKSLEMRVCLWPEFDCPEVTLCGWQDIKIQLLLLHKVYACLAVTCHLHFWQNDQDLLRATAVTRRWNRYWNKSQHRKWTLEKKIILPLLRPFNHESGTLTTELSPPPCSLVGSPDLLLFGLQLRRGSNHCKIWPEY